LEILELYDGIIKYYEYWASNDEMTDMIIVLNNVHDFLVDPIDIGNQIKLVVAFMIIEKERIKLSKILNSFLAHPIVVNCGGEGDDLYLNSLPHNLNNLMFMWEVSDVPFECPKWLEMNMLNRKKVVIGELIGLRTDGQMSLANYKWRFNKACFRGPTPHAPVLRIIEILFFQMPIHDDYRRGGKMLCLQIIKLIDTRTKDRVISYEYVLPGTPINVKTQFLSIAASRSNSVTHEFSMIADWFKHLYVVKLNTKFPNCNFISQLDDSVFKFNVQQYLQELVFSEPTIDMLANILDATNETISLPRRYDEQGPYINFDAYYSELNAKLRMANYNGWTPKIVNQVPRYYDYVYRYLSRELFTLGGQRIYYSDARVISHGNVCFVSNHPRFVWNCKIGQKLCTALEQVLYDAHQKLETENDDFHAANHTTPGEFRGDNYSLSGN